MIGNRCTDVFHCEFSREEDIEGMEPDSSPVFCRPEDAERHYFIATPDEGRARFRIIAFVLVFGALVAGMIVGSCLWARCMAREMGGYAAPKAGVHELQP